MPHRHPISIGLPDLTAYRINQCPFGQRPCLKKEVELAHDVYTELAHL